MIRAYTFALARHPDVQLIVRIPEGEESATLLLRRRVGKTHSTLMLAQFETPGRAGAVAGFLLAMTAQINGPAPLSTPTPAAFSGGPNGHHRWN